MTLPDLNRYHIRRSFFPVHYLYIFHSLVSSHMAYRHGAFDAYDTIFCCGPHHLAEIRETERAYGLPAKNLAEHGYGRLDSLISASGQRTASLRSPQSAKRVVVAPTWGESSLMQSGFGVQLIETLLQHGLEVTLRLHPMTIRHQPHLAGEIEARFTGSRFALERDISAQDALLASDLMISDWSGAALEYSFAMLRPVIWIDTPPKVNNPAFSRIGIEPIERKIRNELGIVVANDKPAAVLDAIARIKSDSAHYHEVIQGVRQESVFNVGMSGPVGAEKILQIITQRPKHSSGI